MQKITPFLWFNNNAEEAVTFYTALFNNSGLRNVQRYGDAGPGPAGSFMTGTMQLEGQDFLVLNGGPMFQFSPAISFSVNCQTEAQVEKLFHGLAEGGVVMMELAKYDFSERYGRVQDKFGISRQISIATDKTAQTIIPSFLFTGEQYAKALEAITFYTSIFANSALEFSAPYTTGEGEKEWAVKYASFSLEGEQFIAMDSGYDHKFSFTSAISFFVTCMNQQEVDTLREKLSAEGQIQQCWWLKDKFGISRQIIPKELGAMLSDPNPVKATNVMQAMMGMKKLDIAWLQEAYEKE